MKVIWATDGSKGAEAALPYLNTFFNRRDCQILVTAVGPAPLVSDARPDPSMLLWNLVPGYRDRVSQELTDLVVGQVELLAKSRAEVTSAVRLGSAPSQILLLAREEQADVIVTGAHGHNAATELLLGSVSQQVAVNAACSVLVVRGRKRPRVLVLAYDGSPDAEAAVDFLAGIRPAAGMALTVVSVAEPELSPADPSPDEAPTTVRDRLEWQRSNARKHSQRAARRLRSAGWTVTARVFNGHAGDALLRATRALSTDLVLLGARGVHSPDHEDRGMGGVPRQLLERAGCTVFIARAPRGEIEV